LKLVWETYQITISFLEETHVYKILIFPLGCPADPKESCYVTEVKRNITKKCIFPFQFNGLEYHGCIADDDFAGKFWCSTKVDEEGEDVSGLWGHCGQGCYIDPKSTGEQIIFFVSFLLIILIKFILNT
jgi:hypothetical protein